MSRRALIGVAAGAVLFALATVAVASPGGTLGQRIVRGRVYNIDRGEAVPVISATVSYRNLNASGSGSIGLAVTDVNGMFAFPIELRRDDVVRLTASAPGFEPFTTSARADTLVGRTPAIEMGIGAPTPGRYRVRGHLRSGNACANDAPNVQLRLQRTGQTARTTSTGAFHFDQLEDGDYVLRVGRRDLELPVTIAGQDEEVRLCLDCPDLPRLEPQRVRAGAPVQVSATGCSALGPGALVQIYFTDRLMVTTGGASPSWGVSFTVPPDTPSGAHRVRIYTDDAGEIASAQLLVDNVCRGDCDGDGNVTIGEILRGVALALGASAEPCPAFGETVTIGDLVAAVDRALRGCN